MTQTKTDRCPAAVLRGPQTLGPCTRDVGHVGPHSHPRKGATGLQRMRRKWRALVREAGPWFLAFLLNLAGCALLFSWIEDGVHPALAGYWAVVSGTTAGFGDVLPHTFWSYVLTIYTLLSSMLLNDVRAARVVKVMVEDPDLHSHEEQEVGQAHDDYQTALLEAAVRGRGVEPQSMPEYHQLQAARRSLAVKESEQL